MHRPTLREGRKEAGLGKVGHAISGPTTSESDAALCGQSQGMCDQVTSVRTPHPGSQVTQGPCNMDPAKTPQDNINTTVPLFCTPKHPHNSQF